MAKASFRVTWAISWERTPASAASLLTRLRSPRVTKTYPPGAETAFTTSESSTPKVHCSVGRVEREARFLPTTFRYLWRRFRGCLLYTSDAADERSSVDLGGRRIIKKK